MDYSKMKLGKQKPKYDRRTLQFSRYLTGTIPFAPNTSHWPNAAPLGMLLNDTVGNCAIAGPLHQEMIWNKANGVIWTATDAMALAGYEAVGGYNPNAAPNPDGSNPTDNGCNMLDVLNYWRQTGLGGKKIGAFVQVNPLNHIHVQHASFFFGGLLVGIQLPVAFQSQNNPAKGWYVPASGLSGDGTPGSWGGHCIYSPGYSPGEIDVVTWGERIPMTWTAWNGYVDEVYGIISTDFIQNPAKAPNGIAMAELIADLQLVTA